MRELSILSLLAEDRQLLVPRFQRGYEWKEKNCEDLWDDLHDIAVMSNRRHFLGVILLSSEEFSGEGYKKVEIIDGQQRLVTTSILMRSLYDHWNSISPNDSVGVYNEFILGGRFDVPYFKMVLNEGEKDFFRKWIQENPANRTLKGKTVSQKGIRKAYEIFSEKIGLLIKDKSVEDSKKLLEKFINRIKTNTHCVIIETATDADAYTIFETINSKKVELTASDLIKNHIFSRASLESASKLTSVQDAWQEMQDDLDEVGASPSTFIRHYWISKESKVSDKDLYRSIKEKYKGDDPGLLAFANSLYNESDLYTQIVRPRSSAQVTPALKKLLDQITKLNIRQCYPLILSGLAVGLDSDSLANLLNTIIKVSFRRSVGDQNPNKLEKIYAESSPLLRTNGVSELEAILEKIRALDVEDPVFMSSFVEIDWDTSMAKYFLEQYQDSKAPADIEMKDVWLEHVLPQKPADLADWNMTKADHEIYLNRIGNLTLVGKEYNKQMSNKPYQQKKAYLKEKSGVLIANEIPDIYPDNWGIEEIKLRTDQLAAFAVTHWKL